MNPDDFPADRQAQTCAAMAGFGFAALCELIENRFEFVIGYTRSLVDNVYCNEVVFFIVKLDLYSTVPGGKPDGVGQKVCQYL